MSGVSVDLVTKDMDKGDTTKISEKIVDLENTLVEDQVLLGDGFAATESIFERDKKKSMQVRTLDLEDMKQAHWPRK